MKSPEDAIREGIYLVPEDRRTTGLVTPMRIRENLTLPQIGRFTRCGCIRRSLEKRHAVKCCRELDIKTPSVESETRTLSGGNQQKVVLSKWLSMEPKVMVFDEPTRGVDVASKAELHALMRRLADRGIFVMMISSDMEEILGVSDRIAVMHEGDVSGVLERSEFDEEAVMRLAVGRSTSNGCGRP